MFDRFTELGAEDAEGLVTSTRASRNLQPLASLLALRVAQQSHDLSIDLTLVATRDDTEAYPRASLTPDWPTAGGPS